MPDKKKLTPTDILNKWKNTCGLNDAELSRALGYQTNYIYLVKSGRRDVSFDLLGRVIYTYGIGGPGFEMAEAMKAE